MGPVNDHDSRSCQGQGCCKPRRRRCLLKGCEEFFQPQRPQARYCSDECRESAKRWRRWRAGQKWRRTESGRQCRRQQSCRYRQRVRERREAPHSCTDRAARGSAPSGDSRRILVQSAGGATNSSYGRRARRGSVSVRACAARRYVACFSVKHVGQRGGNPVRRLGAASRPDKKVGRRILAVFVKQTYSYRVATW